MAESTGETRPRWTNQDHYALLAKIPDSRRSRLATIGTRVGGIVTAIGGGYVANRLGLHGWEIAGAAAPGFLLDVRVGLSLRLERIAAFKQRRQNQVQEEYAARHNGETLPLPDPEPEHPWRDRITVLGSATVANTIAFGTGAAMAFASQEAGSTAGTIAGVTATTLGLLAVMAGEAVTEVAAEVADDSFSPDLSMHRALFAGGQLLYPNRLASGPSPDS